MKEIGNIAGFSGPEHANDVRRMFTRIARRYDLLNRLMSLGQDLRWRRDAVGCLDAGSGEIILDVGCGTGDISIEIAGAAQTAYIVAVDFTFAMLSIGKARTQGGSPVHWLIADAENLPFGEETFDGVISGFLLRNVSSLGRTLKEQYQVLKANGRFVCLDTTRPPSRILQRAFRFHYRRVMPFLGKYVAGDEEAYTYLPDSTERFLNADQLEERIKEAGFCFLGYVRRMFGNVAIHWAEKGDEQRIM